MVFKSGSRKSMLNSCVAVSVLSLMSYFSTLARNHLLPPPALKSIFFRNISMYGEIAISSNTANSPFVTCLPSETTRLPVTSNGATSGITSNVPRLYLSFFVWLVLTLVVIICLCGNTKESNPPLLFTQRTITSLHSGSSTYCTFF